MSHGRSTCFSLHDHIPSASTQRLNKQRRAMPDGRRKAVLIDNAPHSCHDRLRNDLTVFGIVWRSMRLLCSVMSIT